MSATDENQPSSESSLGRRPRLENALELGPRKKAQVYSIRFTRSNDVNGSPTRCLTNPFVHHGRHFGRTVHALCRVHAIINNGILWEGSIGNGEELDSEQYEYSFFFVGYMLKNTLSKSSERT